MDTLSYITEKLGIDPDAKHMPIEIPDAGRNRLAEIFAELGFITGVEIGVADGEYSEIICRANPGVRHFGVDPWRAYRGYRDYVSQERLDGMHAAARERLMPLGAILVRRFSEEAAAGFNDESLDYLYIDGNHDCYHVISDLHHWTPKVRIGGIIAGHDYASFKPPHRMHVVPAVNAWTLAWGIRPWFILGCKAKITGQIRDEHRSWFWIKAPVPPARKGRE